MAALPRPFDARNIGHPLSTLPSNDNSSFDTTPAFDMTYPPGVVGKLAREIEQMMPYPNRTLAIASAVANIAGLAQRAYLVNGMGVNIFIMSPFETGGGKETLITARTRLYDQLIADRPAMSHIREFIGPASFASEPATYKHMATHPKQMCVFNEASFLFEQMGTSDQTHSVGKKKALLDLRFKSSAGGKIQPHVHSDDKKNSNECIMPSLTVHCEGQPERFYQALDELAAEDGLLSRFNIWDATRNYRGPRNKHMRTEFSDKLISALDPLVAMVGKHIAMPGQIPVWTAVELSNEAEILLDKFEQNVSDRLSRKENRLRYNLFNRSHAQGWTLAGLLAIADNPMAPTVSEQHMHWALDTVYAERSMLLRKFESGEIGSGSDQRAAQFIRNLKEKFPTSSNGCLTQLARKNGYVCQRWFNDSAKNSLFKSLVGKDTAQLVSEAIGLLINDGVLTLATPNERDKHGMGGNVYKIDGETLQKRYNLLTAN